MTCFVIQDLTTYAYYPLHRLQGLESKGGRPSKDAIRKEAAQIASEQAQVNDDFQRLIRAQ